MLIYPDLKKSPDQKNKLGICAVMKCMLVERFAICLIHVKCVLESKGITSC